MRAHMTLKYAGIRAELREVLLRDMPAEALRLSEKGTVPILQLGSGEVLDESWDIVKWSLNQNDPEMWAGKNEEHLLEAEMLVETNDYSFKPDLDRYKYADRYPEHDQAYYRNACEEFLDEIEERLSINAYLLGAEYSLADTAIFPFIRQFAYVDKDWFDKAPYPKLQNWLSALITSDLFEEIFRKHEPWKAGDPVKYI
jgi:glutathione S-transferase